MVQYIPFEEELYSDVIGKYVSFSIKVIDECKKVLFSVPDVSPDKTKVTLLCEKCTQGGLSPIHLYDVIEDNL